MENTQKRYEMFSWHGVQFNNHQTFLIHSAKRTYIFAHFERGRCDIMNPQGLARIGSHFGSCFQPVTLARQGTNPAVQSARMTDGSKKRV